MAIVDMSNRIFDSGKHPWTIACRRYRDEKEFTHVPSQFLPDCRIAYLLGKFFAEESYIAKFAPQFDLYADGKIREQCRPAFMAGVNSVVTTA